jgi:glutamyl-Q tRNA(Asp) synthetase
MPLPNDCQHSEVIGRFAPSPTGPLHSGSLVAAVGSWLAARSAGGSWLLRMEDLDRPRVVPGMADDIMRTLEALGLVWDGEVVWQSRRTDAYEAALERLIGFGVAYPCGCSRAEIGRIASAPHGTGGELVYPGLCRAGLAAGKAPRAYRVRVPARAIAFRDGIVGRFSRDLAATCGDFVVKRADGPFAYHLAVVVDDAAAGVNQVTRGADLLDSTPRQLYLQELLGLPHPAYNHLPLVCDPGGSKLSKRDNAVSLAAGSDLGRAGGRLVAPALRFLGQALPRDAGSMPAAELLAWGVAHFDLGLVPTAGGPLPLSDDEE